MPPLNLKRCESTGTNPRTRIDVADYPLEITAYDRPVKGLFETLFSRGRSSNRCQFDAIYDPSSAYSGLHDRSGRLAQYEGFPSPSASPFSRVSRTS